MFTNKNIKQIESQELTPEKVETQVNAFEEGFPPMELIEPATPQNGITILSEDEETRYITTFGNSLSSGLNTIKFVPASGAASRMFKDLYTFLESGEETEFIKLFIERLKHFAFYPQLAEINSSEDKKELIRTLLSDENGLGYGNKPKGLLLFHKYKNKSRTPFEEHLVEAASYCAGSNGFANLHFTISPEHHESFTQLFNEVKSEYEKRFGLKFHVTFSYQHPSTDTVAVDKNNKPFTTPEGNLVFRPGGHGALIRNLNELETDMIFIKNIDNVTTDRLKHETKKYKKAIAGLLVNLRNKVYAYLEKLDKPNASSDEELLKTIENFIKKELFIRFDNNFTTNDERIQFYKNKLNRPIRICGMVKNQGEPGGGPFWAKNPDGTISLQIVEKAQIDLENPQQNELFKQSTHFNPVDIICTSKNYKGVKFNLSEYIDPKTGFISTKSIQGEEVKALELPGLWNGAMSNWNTVFVEVPAETFTPVKTVNDLLRSEHQQ